MRNIKRQLLALLPYNKFIYRAAKHYVDRQNGENDDNMQTNGELWFMRSVLPQCSIVFDVGANVGDWTALALGINPRQKIHCFEPSKATFQRLQVRAGAIYNNFGLSSAPGEMELWVFDEGSGTNSLYKRQGLQDGYGSTEQQRKEVVRMDTLDAYCRRVGVQTIDLMKVDVEGHELEVFKGAKEMLAHKSIQRIQFEYGGCHIDSRVLLKDLFDFFQSYDYSLCKMFSHELRHIPRYDQRLENFQYQNWVALSHSS